MQNDFLKPEERIITNKAQELLKQKPITVFINPHLDFNGNVVFAVIAERDGSIEYPPVEYRLFIIEKGIVLTVHDKATGLIIAVDICYSVDEAAAKIADEAYEQSQKVLDLWASRKLTAK